MTKFLLLACLSAGMIGLSPAMAQGPRSNINLEPTCTGTGGGMDPRCIGDVTPGSDRALRRTPTGQRFDSRVTRPRASAKKSKRVAINCSLRANRNHPRCMR